MRKLKKRCKYCNGIVKVKEEEIKNIEDNGRGILCDLCGNFIEIPKKEKQIDGNVKLSSGHIRSGIGLRLHKNKTKKQFILGVFLIIALIIPIYYFIAFEPLQSFLYIERKNSTFTFLDEYTKHDISDELNITIFTSKEGVKFKDNKDIYTMSYYDKTIHNKKVSSIQIDIRSFSYIWIYTDPMNTSIYKTDYYLREGGNNYHFTFKLKMEPQYYDNNANINYDDNITRILQII